MQKHVVAIALGALAATNLLAASVTVHPPHGQVAELFEVENGEWYYSVSKGGKPVVGSSKVEIFAVAKGLVAASSAVSQASYYVCLKDGSVVCLSGKGGI